MLYIYSLLFISFILLLVFFVDIPLAFYIAEHLNKNLYKAAEIVTKFGSFKYIVLINTLLYLYFYYKKNKEKSSLIIGCIISQGISASVIFILKRIFGRGRPFFYLQNNTDYLIEDFNAFFKYVFGIFKPLIETQKHDFYFLKMSEPFVSFPSGHSAGIWGFVIAMCFFTKNKYIKICCIMFGILVPITRIILLQHYLSDILVGSVLSAFIVFLMMNWYIKNESSNKWIKKINNYLTI
ncbi:MAG: phosphatase PAP2 family protein [Rickettsiales bacterium]|nr:MAG: phosphatase PAP2 family protein [Rickettsiales bacterium]